MATPPLSIEFLYFLYFLYFILSRDDKTFVIIEDSNFYFKNFKKTQSDPFASADGCEISSNTCHLNQNMEMQLGANKQKWRCRWIWSQ